MAECSDEEGFQRILECPICLERITDPRCLPCLHSFCGKCIGQHMDEKQKDGSFPCPVCTLLFKVPPDGVTGFKPNFYLIQISELFPVVSEVKCDFCKLQGADNSATSMCIQCKDHLCQRCADFHCLTKVTVEHHVVSLEEVRSGQHLEEIRQFQQIHCSKHAKKTLEIYCENCVKPLCHLCAMLEHKQHEMKNLEEAAAEAVEVMKGLLKPWTVASDHSIMLSAERKKVLDNLVEEEELLIKEIQQVYNTFKEDILVEIESKMNQSIEVLKVEIAKARKQAEMAYNEAEFSRVNISSTLKYCQKILDSAQDVEKLQQFQDIKARLDKLDIRKMEKDVIKPVFRQHPSTLAIPDLTRKTLTEHEKERVALRVSEICHQPVIREKVALVHSYDVLNPQNVRVNKDYYYGLTLNDDWLIATFLNSHQVKVFDRSSGSFVFQMGRGQHNLQYPRGVTCTDEGDIFVTYDSINGVVRYNSKGEVMKVTPNVFKSWGGITCHDDQIIMADYRGERLLIADFECNINKVITKVSLGLSAFRPWYVCVDKEGHLVVSDYGQGRVHVIDYKQSVIVKTFSEGLTAACPLGVCFDEWGHILVADYNNNQVVLMSDQSEHPRVLITCDDVSRPTDLAVTGPGEVAVLEEDTGMVKVFKYADI